MKKALALVLALVLALSMAVSAFAATKFLVLDPKPVDEEERLEIEVVDAADKTVIYTDEAGTYYVALEDQPWKDVKVTANGNVTAKLVDFDPEKMVIVDKDGNDLVKWCVTEKGKEIETSGLTYDVAKDLAKQFNNEKEVTYYGVKMLSNVNVIEITIEDNYTAHYTEGSVVVEATLNKKAYKGDIVTINDVTIFEYEEVKWTAANFEDEKALVVGEGGYSDYATAEDGYSKKLAEYDETLLRKAKDAAVVSTTAFRAIEGEDLLVLSAGMKVVLKDIVKGQKGVNFKGYYKEAFVDENLDGKFDMDKENLTAIEFGFYGDQVVKGAYEIAIELEYDWYELRELFGLKVEEDDIISYYLVDENGKVVGGKEVDYMTADLTEDAEFTIKGENDTLGQYKLVLDVPAAEVGEANPNTGAESVVGVVAALAVVSVATAAAVSLKK